MPIELFSVDPSASIKIPFYQMSVSAGIPVPVESGSEALAIDLNQMLIERPASTFFARISGSDLKDAGIFDGDILIIDTSIKPTDGKLVLAVFGDNMTVKYYRNIDGEIFLESQDSGFYPLEIGSDFSFEIIGTVTRIIHSI